MVKRGHETVNKAKVNKTSTPFFQPKLTINQPNDIYEQEADAVAEKVMRMPDTKNDALFFQPKPISVMPVQRKCSACEQEEKLQRKEDDEEQLIQQKKINEQVVQRKCAHCEEEEESNVQMKGEPTSTGGVTAPSIVHDVINTRGQPMDKGTRNFMESRFGYDFGNVRVHNDSFAHQSSKDINALAYTHGNHIVFGSGQYQPQTYSGKKLLAHELGHVLQQDSLVRRKPLTPEEKEEDLKSDRLKDDERLQTAFDNSPVMPSRVNETSEGVKTLQRALHDLNYLLPVSFRKTGDADGIFGKETTDVVKQFQRDNNLKDSGKADRETLRVLDNKFNPEVFIESVFFGEENKELIDNDTDWSATGNRFFDWAGSPYHIVFKKDELFADTIPISVIAGKTMSAIAKVRVKGGIAGDLFNITSKPVGSSQPAANAFSFNGNDVFSNTPGEDIRYIGLSASTALPGKISLLDFFLSWQTSFSGKTNGRSVSQHTAFVTANKASNTAAKKGTDIPNIPTFKRMKKAFGFADGEPANDPGKIAYVIITKFPNYGVCDIPYDPRWDTATFKCPVLQFIWEMSDFEGPRGHFQCITIAHYTNAVLNVLGVPNIVNVSVLPVVIWADKNAPEKGLESSKHRYSERHRRHPDWRLGLIDGNCGINNFEACVKLRWNAPNGVLIEQYYCGGVTNKPGGFKTPTEILHKAFISLSYVKRMSKNDPRNGFPRGIRMNDLAVYNQTDECKTEKP